MDGGKGGEMTAGEDGTYRAKDFKKWLQTRAGEWESTAELKMALFFLTPS